MIFCNFQTGVCCKKIFEGYYTRQPPGGTKIYSWKTVCFSEEIMSMDIKNMSSCQMEAIFNIAKLSNNTVNLFPNLMQISCHLGELP